MDQLENRVAMTGEALLRPPPLLSPKGFWTDILRRRGRIFFLLGICLLIIGVLYVLPLRLQCAFHGLFMISKSGVGVPYILGL